MAHTPAYFVAAAIVDHGFSWKHASEENIQDPVVHALIDQVEVGEPIEEDVDRFMHGARVSIHTRGGQVFESTVHAPRGSVVRGVAWRDVDEKFHALVARVQPDAHRRERMLDAIHGLAGLSRVSQLTALLH